MYGFLLQKYPIPPLILLLISKYLLTCLFANTVTTFFTPPNLRHIWLCLSRQLKKSKFLKIVPRAFMIWVSQPYLSPHSPTTYTHWQTYLPLHVLLSWSVPHPPLQHLRSSKDQLKCHSPPWPVSPQRDKHFPSLCPPALPLNHCTGNSQASAGISYISISLPY